MSTYTNTYIQKQLNNFNAGLVIDGVIGDKSKFWIHGLQYAGGLKTDGIYGNKTHAYAMSIVNSSGKYTAHFKDYEFDCPCCGKNPGINIDTLILLEAIRYKYKRAIATTSGYRCVKHNKAVGGEPASYHLYAKAADFVVSGIPASAIYGLCNNMNLKGGVGKYFSFTHVDCRGYRSRWN